MNCVDRKLLAIAAVLLATSVSALAQDRANPGDGIARGAGPLKIIYRIAGIRDTGGAGNTGIATLFQCANFSGADQGVFIFIRDRDGNVAVNGSFSLPDSSTITASTKTTLAFADDVVLGTGTIAQGQAVIRATSVKIVCSAMIVNAAASVPVGIALHMQRSNPMKDTEE